MASPWVNLLSNEPGGGFNAAMKANNALANENVLRQINQIKKQYLPTTMQAEAASKLAYANFMGPQFLSKLLQNPGAIANMGDDSAKAALQKAVGAGMGQGSGMNAFNQMQQGGHPTGIGQPGTNSLSGWIVDKFKNAFGSSPKNQPSNPFSDSTSFSNENNTFRDNGWDSDPGMITSGSPFVGRNGHKASSMKRPTGGVTVQGEQWYDKNGNPVYDEEIKERGQPTVDIELTKGITPKTYAQKTGEHLGTIKQLEQEGKHRADALKQVGESQLGLSHSGAVLDRMTGIITNPVYLNMRNKIPGFQNKQLDYLKVMGTPEEKELIGDLTGTGESFIASTVQGFSGKPLVREFDLAQRQKITGHDTPESAKGKLRSAISLHDIADKKLQIISELLHKGYNESDAVRKANKMVDVSAIEKETNARLQRKITIEDDKGNRKVLTIEEAKKMGVPNV